MNLNISVINGENLIKFGTPVGNEYAEGTLSQIFNLGSRYGMKCRKLSPSSTPRHPPCPSSDGPVVTTYNHTFYSKFAQEVCSGFPSTNLIILRLIYIKLIIIPGLISIIHTYFNIHIIILTDIRFHQSRFSDAGMSQILNAFTDNATLISFRYDNHYDLLAGWLLKVAYSVFANL